jgi:anaerobic magnesium-protoporphyrin IX monomethyl ester cyclase
MFRSVLIRPSNVTGSAYLTKWGFLPVPLGILQLAGCLLSMKNSVVKVIDMEADSTKDVDSVVE